MQSSSSLALSKFLFYITKQLRTFHAIEKEQLLTVSRIPLNCKNKLRNFLLVHCISKTRFRKTHILKHPQNSVDIHKNLIKRVYNQVKEKINIVSRNGGTFLQVCISLLVNQFLKDGICLHPSYATYCHILVNFHA